MKLPVSHTTSSVINLIRHVNFITILKEKIVKTKIRQSQFPLFSLVCFPASTFNFLATEQAWRSSRSVALIRCAYPAR